MSEDNNGNNNGRAELFGDIKPKSFESQRMYAELLRQKVDDLNKTLKLACVDGLHVQAEMNIECMMEATRAQELTCPGDTDHRHAPQFEIHCLIEV